MCRSEILRRLAASIDGFWQDRRAWSGQTKRQAVMQKFDVKKTMKALFQPPAGRFVEIDVPPMRFVMVDGAGNPNLSEAYQNAVSWLYAISYAMKFASKQALARDYVVPPLEGLWWADDPKDFVRRNKTAWRWTMMIMVPDGVPDTLFEAAQAKASVKLGAPPQTLRLGRLHEGRCLQTMHIGSYDDEGPTLAHLHDVLMPEMALTFNGHHHEIYIGDPRRVAPERLKTVLRQPVKPVAP
jgi:hypothetical protein